MLKEIMKQYDEWLLSKKLYVIILIFYSYAIFMFASLFIIGQFFPSSQLAALICQILIIGLLPFIAKTALVVIHRMYSNFLKWLKQL